jgi:PKD repeat protein/streptogramin lyase
MKKYSNLGVSFFALMTTLSSLVSFRVEAACPSTLILAGTVISTPVTYSGQVQVNGSLTITSTGSLTIIDAGSGCNGDLIIGTLGSIANSGSITISGDLVNNSTSLLKPYSGTGSLTMNSTLHTQTISAGSSGGIKVSKFHITGLDKTLKGELVVNDTLDLQAIIHTGSSDTLGIDSAGVAVNWSSTGFVQGPLYRRGRPGLGSIDSNPMIFPVGDTSGYRPVILSNLPLNTYPVIRVEAVPALSATASFNGNVSELFHTTYWQVNSLFGGSFNANITLVFAPSKDAGGMPGSSLLVANLRSTGGPDGSYTSLGNGSSTANSITSASTLSASGSPTNYFALASTCLPVTGTLVANPGDSICPGETVNFSVTSPSASYDSLYYYVNSSFKVKLDSGKVFASSSFSPGDIVYAVMKTGACADTTNKITMHVSAQTANAGQDQTSCGSGSVTLNGKITYSSKPQWSITTGSGTISNPLVSNTSYTPSAADIVAGSVTLTLKAVEVGCQPASDVMQITFNTLPAITTQPRDTAVCQGATVKFKVAATGSGLTYQWQENGSTITNGGIYSGQGTSVLTLSPVTAGNTYQVIVSGACTPSVTSSRATLTVNSCVVCDTSWTIAGAPFCIASLKSKLNPTVSGGVFSGTGVSEIPAGSGTYYFDPAVSGAGTFNVTYTRPSCGKSLTKQITVNDAPCAITIAGGPSGIGATFLSKPQGLYTDCSGIIYFSDADSNRVYKVDPVTGIVTILADKTDGLLNPLGLIVDPFNGDIYVANSGKHQIVKITSPHTVSVFAGSPTSATGFNDAVGTAATFNNPYNLAFDATGKFIFVSDYNNCTIRKIDKSTASVTTLLGSHGACTNSADGPAAGITLYDIQALVADATSLYFSSATDNLIRKLDFGSNMVSTVVKNYGYADGPLGTHAVNQPTGLSLDCSGNVFFSDKLNCSIRESSPTGNVTTVAGSFPPTRQCGFVDGTGSVARFWHPTGLSVYNKGYIDVADTDNKAIRRFAINNWKAGAFSGLDTTHCLKDSPDNLSPVTCSAGGKYKGNGIQGTGPYTFNPLAAGVGRHKITYTFSAGFCTDSLITYVNVYPMPAPNLGADTSVCTNDFGKFTLNAGVFKSYQWYKSASPNIQPFPTNPILDTNQTYKPFLPPSSPYYYAVYVTDNNGCKGSDERMVTTLSTYTVDLGLDRNVCEGIPVTLTPVVSGGGGVSSTLWQDSTGGPGIVNYTVKGGGVFKVNLTFANGCSNSDVVNVSYKFPPDVTISSTPAEVCATYVSAYAALPGSAIGSTDGSLAAAQFSSPQNMVKDNAGNFYITDKGNGKIRKITPGGTVSTFASGLDNPYGITIDKNGNLYVTEQGAKNDIKKITPGGVVSTYAGFSGSAGWNGDGPKNATKFWSPAGIVIDGAGNLYVADFGNDVVRMISPLGFVKTLGDTTTANRGTGNVNGNYQTSTYVRPQSLTIDQSGYVYVGNTTGLIRKIDPFNQKVSLYSSPGGNINGLAIDNNRKLYASEQLNYDIKYINPKDSTASLFAGQTNLPGSTNGMVPTAKFDLPNGLYVDPGGFPIYVADKNTIRIITDSCKLLVCPNTSTVTLTAPAGLSNYTWKKSGSATVLSSTSSLALTNATAGKYYVSANGANGCTGSDTIEITLKPGPIADAGPGITRCGSAQIGTPGIVGNTYSWNTNPPTGVFSTSAQTVVSTVGTTNYVVTVTGANLCTNSDTVSVTITPGPIVNLGKDTSACQFESFQKGPAMAPQNKYQWGSLPAGPDSTYSPITISADFVGTTKYFLSVTDTLLGCTVSDTVVVTVNSLPPVSVSTVPNSAVCRGTTINITVAGGDYTKYHYDWQDLYGNPAGFSPSDTVFNPHYKIQATKTYQLTIADRKTGCKSFGFPGAAMLNSPLAGFISSSYCFPDSTLFTDTSFTGGPYNLIDKWEWIFGDPSTGVKDTIQQTSQAPVYHSFSAAGIYNTMLIVTNDGNCTDTAKVSIQINDVTAGFTVASVACTGDSVKFVNLSSPVTASYRWDFGEPVTAIDSGALNPVIVYTAPNTYNIKLKASVAGCSDSTTGSVTVKSKPVVKIIPTAISSCSGSSDTLSISSLYDSPADSVVWQNLSTAAVLANDTSKIVVTATGDYKVTVTDRASQCGASDSVNISFINPPANPAIIAPPGGCLNSGIKLIGTVTGDSLKFVWTTSGGGAFSAATNDTTLYTPGPLDASPLIFAFSAYNRCDSLAAAPQSVTLTAAPTGFFTFTPAEPFENDQLTFVNYTDTSAGKVTSWVWKFGDGTTSTLFNPTHAYLKAGKYYPTLSISNNFGCTGDIKDSVNVSGPRIFIPNVFAPTATNPENMVCKVYGVGISPLDFSFKIFDKWGTVVYQSTDFVTANTVGWNGNNLNGGEPLPMGVYTYAVKGHFYDGDTFQKAGTVTLIR